MKQKLLTLLVSSFLFTCGEENAKNGKIVDTLANKLADTSAAIKVNKALVHSINCQYDNEVSTLGIGLIIPPTRFHLFNDSLLSSKFATKDMYSEFGNKTEICSKFFKPDYGIMHFVCIGITKKAYKVLINYSDIKYFPKTKAYTFKTWNKYILASFGIRRIISDTGNIPEKYSLRNEPNDNASILTIPKGHEMFCPIEIKGDWIKVTYDCFYNKDNNPYEGEPCHNYINNCNNPVRGWLKWREENKLLIDIFLMP